MRAFSSTRNFAENFVSITNASEERAAALLSILSDTSTKMAEGVCVPALGLSNKAMFAGGDAKIGGEVEAGEDDEETVEAESTIQFQSADLKGIIQLFF